MTPSKRTAITWFVAGVIAFVVVAAIEWPIRASMAAHRAAGDAEAVNAIHLAWVNASMWGTARAAMIADLVFIGIYGLGCLLSGLYFISREQVVLRALGWTALVSGGVFLVTDYTETIAQFIQFVRFAGSNDLAAAAALMGPPKVASWIAGFLAVILALIAQRLSSRAT